ncbi:His Kinase A (phospho-acceptor) domain-containing protein [Paucidesulfovibrio gracilis DSM 16080]|uniref:histidine kinase n=1 Tax=Paucidesulfovibrio gracilis DSM 16080 TaxID=1121449 RepID=A0A1T4WTN6_9BACT|nr:PAS domain-containing sensor histidine kinase [Paucidesulfovibrio gracilis]SKA79981.1 His Kinase A (phospho-acceptor) domain-containing protein [Paucidesulfovibrio gracilis DSM 16080]
MKVLTKLRRLIPEFWDTDPDAGPYKSLFNYRRIWWLAIGVLAVVALVPLIVMTFIDYNVTRTSLESENLLRAARTTSNTRRAVSYFLDERKNALKYVAIQEDVTRLADTRRLAEVLEALKQGFGGFVDLGLIDDSGRQVAYVGPYQLQGRDYSAQAWFQKAKERGAFISSVFRGYRDVPHLIVAIKCPANSNGQQYVLRATLDTEQFNNILSSLDLSGGGDAFLVDVHGMLQTPSRWNGPVLSHTALRIPKYSDTTQVMLARDETNREVIVGYAYITDTPFILLLVKPTAELMKPWQSIRIELLWLLVVSVAVILLVIAGVATYMVGKIYLADQTRAKTLHHMEHTNRMASIGRLAAGVAHEINNPLAIINEKAGLIRDLFTYKKEYAEDVRLVGIVDSIISSVERCGTITKRLLGFARHIDVRVEQIRFGKLVEEVLGFLHKEAEYRSITIDLRIDEQLPEFESDRGKLQQILLNLVNNAFQAMNDGGRLEVAADRYGRDAIRFIVKDNGCGIPEADRKRIFEPFFSTKKKRGGTGLGLSITYGLVQELGGEMTVESEVGKGTTFAITLPLQANIKEGANHEHSSG